MASAPNSTKIPSVVVILDDDGTNQSVASSDEESTAQLPSNVCFCSERKRHWFGDKVHVISDDGPAKKRARVCGPGCCSRGAVDVLRQLMMKELRDRIRQKEQSRGEAKKKLLALMQAGNKVSEEEFKAAMSHEKKDEDKTTLSALEDDDDKANDEDGDSEQQQLLKTVESLLFVTASTVAEYTDMATLDERLRTLLGSILKRRLNKKIAERQRQAAKEEAEWAAMDLFGDLDDWDLDV
ncbi:expressed unknown protein [Seminavis robusta]|uniref:Uncharacterized protein n=1 Tax=Seminavis robusta TaxID=568900 RepID=A0A9N8I0M8_9STRA|nr:expressed unknown protein [Seminavis robusta]|eukprot:Sro2786_g337050.1 n/a (239) ;mRNA; r:7958-8764